MGEEAQVQIVMLPWLAQGHINPFVNLSKALASRGDIKVSIVSTPVNISKIRSRLHWEPSINLLQLPLPSVDGLPPGVESTADIKPESVHLLHSAFDQLEKPFECLLKRISPNFVVYDVPADWAATVAARLEIPSFLFSVYSPAAFAYFLGHAKRAENSNVDAKAEDLRQPPTDYPLPTISWALFEAHLVFANITAFAHRAWACCQRSCGILIKSCFEEENKYMQYLSRITGKPVVSVGPLMLPEALTDTSGNHQIQWLDKQRPASVVFVSFGSESFLSAEQITELASALEDVGLPFLWSLRSSDGTSSALSLLPEGFEGRTRDRGLVVGGWSSVMEAWLHSGLPLVLIPLRHDQGLNCRQIVLELKGGIEVERSEEGSFRREDVSKAVRTVMGKYEERGEQIRSRVRELGGVVEVNTQRQEAYMGELVTHMKKLLISRKEKAA